MFIHINYNLTELNWNVCPSILMSSQMHIIIDRQSNTTRYVVLDVCGNNLVHFPAESDKS